ncbi:MAG: GntR family transcriptional regulator [Proteobacteria bacterium]|nr:GntR family transcriptional regulator [Pseudomonadota bacterium]
MTDWSDGADHTKYVTKREFAAEAIRNAIENGFYQPGEVVSQRRLMEDLSLSVTPIREAIIHLAATGLVDRHSHHSIKVKAVDAVRLSDIYRVRTMLELDAVRLSFKNIRKPTIDELKRINSQLKQFIKSPELEKINSLDRQFHYVVFSQAQSAALTSSIEFIKSSFSFYGLWSTKGRLAQSVREHGEFIENLEAGDVKGCVDAHRRHLESGLKAALMTVPEKAGR